MHKAGLYREKESSRLYRAYGLTFYLMFSVGTVFHTIFVFQTFATDDIKKFATALNMTLTLYSVQYKALWFITNLSNIKSVLVDLLQLCYRDNDNQNSNLKRQAIKVSKVVKMYFASAFLTVAVSVGLSLVHHQARVIPFETTNIIGYKTSSTIYWIMVVYQFLISVYGVVVNYSADLFPVILMALATGLLEDLSKDMALVCTATGNPKTAELNRTDCEEKLGKQIGRHVKIQKLVEDISKDFSQVVLWQAVMSSVIFCTSVFLLTIVSCETQFLFH